MVIACLPAAILASLLCTARADDYIYAAVRAPHGRQFNVVAEVAALSDDPSASILLCVRNKDNCYRIDFTRNSTRIVKVEMGTDVPIGTSSGKGLTGEAPHAVVVKRRRLAITVALDGEVVARAYDDSFRRGKTGSRVKKDTATFQRARSYDCGEVHFGDDFMTDKAADWEPITGQWSALAEKNPTLSSNPFKYSGKNNGPPALAAMTKAGSSKWDDYSAAVTARDDAGAPIGLAFYYVDAKNYHLFRLDSRKHENPKVQLLRIRNGAQTVLAETEGHYLGGQFHRIRVDVDGTTAKGFIDDNLLLTAKDNYLVGGTIGLYTESRRGATFDDVVVRDLGQGHFRDDLETPRPGTYLELGGTWIIDRGVMTGSAKGPAKAITGDSQWRNCVLSCDIHPYQSGAAGLTFYYQDELNYFLYRAAAGGKRELLRYFDGVNKVLASVDRPLAEKPEHTVISNMGGLITLAIDGEQVADAFDPGLSEGQIGLYVEDGTASFSQLDLTTPPPPEPVMSVTDAFKAEKSMQAFVVDWTPSGHLDKYGRKWWWHRTGFFGDASVELGMTKDTVDNTSFQLSLAAESNSATSGDPATGYTMTVWKAGYWQLSISRQGKEIARSASVFKRNITKLEFYRRGEYLFGKINRKLEIRAKDNQPLSGSQVGYALVPPEPKELKARVYSPNVLNYDFTRSPDAWRYAAGEWDVMRRWSCDDRWTWFGGIARNGPAVAWNKHTFTGDFSVELCGAIQMRAGIKEYSDARDMNVTVAADGRDLTSGYSFIYGGWDNTLTCLTRKGEIVARATDARKHKFSRSSNMHRRWWYYKIERKGGRLRWYVDNELVLEYTDPEPLGGNRIALWAYDVGISVPRVRIGAEQIGAREHPGGVSDARPGIIYDIIP